MTKKPSKDHYQLKERQKVESEVFDQRTLKVLSKLIKKGMLQSVDYPVSTGKEANVFRATTPSGSMVAVKIYKVETGPFFRREEYLDGDPRFTKIKHNNKDIVCTFAKKEFKNLTICEKAGINSPKAYYQIENILIMEFLGEGELPYPNLIMVDAKGVKIGKSEGNVIALNDEPSVLFGKIMSLGDDAIIPMLNLLSDISSEEIVTLDIQKNAMSLKKMVAEIIIKQLYGVELASQARAKFENTFGRGEFPTDALEIKAPKESRLVDILVSEKIIESKSEFRRLIEAGAISDFPDQKISDPNEMIGGSKRKIKVGKKTFVLIVPL